MHNPRVERREVHRAASASGAPAALTPFLRRSRIRRETVTVVAAQMTLDIRNREKINRAISDGILR